MKAGKYLAAFFLTACCVYGGIAAQPYSIQAARIDNVAAARQKALEKIPNATVTDVDRDYEGGVPVYDVELVKGSKKYEITYRASDAKILEYSWEKITVGASRSKSLISRSKCKSLANKRVKNGTIVSLTRKTDDGIDIYKVIMTAGNKRYTLKFHARTGALIDYKWKLAQASGSSDNAKSYIGLSKAKQIALDAVPNAAVVKAEFDTDDGAPVYEVELVKGAYEYEYKIHAKTGKILEYDKELKD